MDIQFPPFLQKGDKVVIVSPSSKIDQQFLKGAKKRMESWGLKVAIGKHAGSSSGRYAGTIKQRLKEEKGQGGAYYCSLPSFRDSYRLVTRMLERSGQSAYLMLCSLTDGKGHPLEKPEKLELLSEELQNTIQHCLRKGDSFTKYSPSQYLVLLIGTNKENCGLIFDRIRKYFAREHRSWNKYVEFYVSVSYTHLTLPTKRIV